VSGQKQMCHCGQAIKLFLKNVRWAKNKKHRVGMSVGFLVWSIYFFLSVLSQWFTFYFSSVVCLFTLGGNAQRVAYSAAKTITTDSHAYLKAKYT